MKIQSCPWKGERTRVAAGARAADLALWIGLAACASVLLLAVTSHLTQNVAPIPLLWVAPLSLYLLSFILCFESDRLYPRWLFLPLLPVRSGCSPTASRSYENNTRYQAPDSGAVRRVVCVLHGVPRRAVAAPAASAIPDAVLSDDLGRRRHAAACSSRWSRPALFHDYLELPIAMAGCAILVTCVLWKRGLRRGTRPLWMRRARSLLADAWDSRVYLGISAGEDGPLYVRSARNFYGVLHVRDDAADDYGIPAERVLVHGTIDHGTATSSPGAARIATSYFGRSSGINRAIRALREKRGRLRIGVLGLGAGVTATLANAGDTLHYYEINPLVLDIATHRFRFLQVAPPTRKF